MKKLLFIMLLYTCSIHFSEESIISMPDENINNPNPCHELNLMNFFFEKEFSKPFCVDEFSFNPEDDKIITRSIPTYFRFLSVISGLDSPYNKDVIYIIKYSPDIIHNPDNVKLIDWYFQHQDSISCELFNEYYNLEISILNGPKHKCDNFDDEVRLRSNFIDSISNLIDIFIETHQSKKNR